MKIYIVMTLRGSGHFDLVSKISQKVFMLGSWKFHMLIDNVSII